MKLGIWPPIVIYRGDEHGEHEINISEVVFPYRDDGRAPPNEDLVISMNRRAHDCQLRRVPMAILRHLDLEAGLKDAFRAALAEGSPRFPG